jgi:serine/threonine protein kinase/TolB-like protein/Flp pilus assembly protein TadD
MGVTYLAVDNVLRRKVALKVINVPAAARTSHAVRERFLREARAAAALRHPNVAAVYRFGASPDDSHCYYAMELVEGETLEARVHREGPLNPKLVLEIAMQITRALIAAAAHGLIHRDLKPGNIMLTRGDAETAELEVKVIDFGLAKAIADAGGEMDLTHGGFVGTPNFASPEQFESGPVDMRSDIYSLGATLWFALTGKTPLAGRNIEEIRRAQKTNALPLEELKAARVPLSLRSLLQSMLAFEPAGRPGIQDLAAQLRRCSALADIEIAADAKKEILLELAHVLFIDIVGYSKLSINEEQAAVNELTQIVRSTEQFQKAEEAERLIKIPSGDGMALVFYTSPDAPVRCAMQISRALKGHPRLHIRMGIHSGPVSGVVDVAGGTNLAGAGLNLAQRVMKCGDAGHILLSKRVAEDLSEFDEWRPLLQDLGTCEVKHGMQLAVVNLWSEDVGNRQIPQALRALRKHRARLRWAQIAAALLLLAGIVAAFMLVSKKSARFTSIAPEKTVAVLPFENLSEDKANAYFAEGIQDEILTRLAKIADLKVISRSSTQQYQSKPANLAEIAKQLGVANILEGSVQKAADQVRVNVQLINAQSDSHLWAESYDRKLTDVFNVESEIAKRIAESLQAKLSPAQANALAAMPTRDAEAYDLFLKGEYQEREAESTYKGETYDRAASFYRQALARDPNFALAYAGLAYNRLYRHWYVSRLTSAQLEEVRSNVERALAIAPDSPEAHLAMGIFHYWGRHDFDTALREFDRAIELQPNNSDTISFRAAIYRRRGEWRQALAEFERAMELDPRAAWMSDGIGATYLPLRRWSEAEHWFKHALALDPHHLGVSYRLSQTYIASSGDIQRARRAWEGVPIESRKVTEGAYEIVISEMIDNRVYLDVLERHFSDALKEWDAAPDNTVEGRLTQLKARIGIHVLAGQNMAAKRECEETRVLLEAQLAQRRKEDSTSFSELAWIYVCLGRNADALRLAREAAESMPVEKDAILGANFLVGLAQIEAHTGQPEEAVKLLRKLLTIPAGEFISVARLKIDPVWDPIRNDPGFRKLLSGPEPETVYK